MQDQVDMNVFLQAIEREREAWNALQHPPLGVPKDNQLLYAAWVHAVTNASVEAERFLQASKSRRQERIPGVTFPAKPGKALIAPSRTNSFGHSSRDSRGI